ncbi:MAG: TolB protein [Flavobacteriales bacterium]|jgi:TolB protein
MVFALLILCISQFSFAELSIEITQGADNPTPIAIVPFGGASSGLPENLQKIISDDLHRSGLFAPIAVRDMLSHPAAESDIYYRDWRLLGSSYLVIGSLTRETDGYALQYALFDVLAQRLVLRDLQRGSESELRDIAHSASDAIFEALTDIRGVFSTKIIYVEDMRREGPRRYRLVKADADGAREEILFASSEPLMSPSWSRDGTQVAYVSFETSRPAIFRQNLDTGAREQLTNFKGLNNAPSWSPDGRRLAFVLSKDGDPEIYVLDIALKKLTRVTRHFSIDTEPNWTPDGKSIIFTSDRGGKPQIYQIGLASGVVERLTFDGDYNARPRITADGKSLIMVHRENGVFHIAWQDLASGRIRILTETWLDESPTLAPNGAMLLYATQHNNKGVLAAVSIDAGVKYKLPSKTGDVREPAWSPFISKELRIKN